MRNERAFHPQARVADLTAAQKAESIKAEAAAKERKRELDALRAARAEAMQVEHDGEVLRARVTVRLCLHARYETTFAMMLQ